MEQQVIHLIMCDRAYPDPRNLHRLRINGLMVRLRTRHPLPVRIDFGVAVMMGGYIGAGRMWLRIVYHSTNQRIVETPRRRFRFPLDPDEVAVFQARVDQCNLSLFGRYRLELCLEDEVIASRPFWLVPRM